MRRVELIDGLRGYFLVFMLLTHLMFVGGYVLVRINHAELGFVQDAQGFVFLSGLLVGAIYGRRMTRDGFAAAALQMWRRALQIYAYFLGSMLAVLGLSALLPGAHEIWAGWLGLVATHDYGAKAAAMLMLYQAAFFDILPQYIVYLLVAPPLLWLCLNGRAAAVVIASALVWLGVQFGLHLPLVEAVDRVLATWQPDLTVRSVFNPLAWQFLFFTAMAIGTLWSKRKLDVARFFDPRRTGLAGLAAGFVFFFMCWRLAFTFLLVPDPVTHVFRHFESRPDFSTIFLVNFIALGYLVAWLLIAGPCATSGFVRSVSAVLRRLFSTRFLCLLGRYSLQVYAWHVLLVYLVIYLDGRFGPLNELAKTAIALTAILLLAVPPLLIERRKNARGASAPAERTSHDARVPEGAIEERISAR